MIKEIKYGGVSNVPSDIDCEDGELESAINFVIEDTGLQPFVHPKEIMKIIGVLLCVHKGGYYENYITYDDDRLYTQTLTSERQEIAANINGLPKVEVLGNTLIVLGADNPIKYLLYKDDAYKYLGSKPPFPSISFGLKGTLKKSDEIIIAMDKIYVNSIYSEFTDSNKTRVSDQVLGEVNKFIQEQSRNTGKFIYPFFVRYAFRLYDGSLFMHSAPILMLPSSGLAPVGIIEGVSGSDGRYDKLYLKIAAFTCSLTYCITNYESIFEELNNWSEIITGIDIFISAPIYTYDQNEKCWGIDHINVNNYPYYGIMNYNNENDGAPLPTPLYRKLTLHQAEPSTIAILRLPEVDKAKLLDDIVSTSIFYKIKDVGLNTISSDRKDIELKENILNVLHFQEIMSDDYNSHNLIMAQCSATYNARLNIANIKQRLSNGFPSDSLVCYENGHKYSDTGIGIGGRLYTIQTFIKSDNKDIVVNQNGLTKLWDNVGGYLYFPNSGAYRMILMRYYDDLELFMETEFADIKLTPHPNLNGAYYFGYFQDINWSKTAPADFASASANPVIYSPNKLFNSEVNNPFLFPVSGIVTVGTSDIRAIASTTSAVSQGQFGQFPMNIFTGEGIWALEVSQTGTYSSRQMIARDVINNGNSLLRLDGAVAFSTDRGVMMLQSSDVICISANLTYSKFATGSLQSFGQISSMLDNEIIEQVIDTTIPFNEFLIDCLMAYDYANSRILIINPNLSYAYIFNIKTKKWTTITSEYISVTNNYPNSYLTERDGGVSNLSAIIPKDDSYTVRGFIITRPIKLDSPDILKTISTVVHNGIFREDKISTIMLGSRDAFNYTPIASSVGKFIRRVHGTPYKYFRFVIVADFSGMESISKSIIEFAHKYTNKLR